MHEAFNDHQNHLIWTRREMNLNASFAETNVQTLTLGSKFEAQIFPFITLHLLQRSKIRKTIKFKLRQQTVFYTEEFCSWKTRRCYLHLNFFGKTMMKLFLRQRGQLHPWNHFFFTSLNRDSSTLLYTLFFFFLSGGSCTCASTCWDT